MAHDHHHAHHPRAKDYSRAFALGVAPHLGFVLIEAVPGFLGSAVALAADAGHNLSAS